MVSNKKITNKKCNRTYWRMHTIFIHCSHYLWQMYTTFVCNNHYLWYMHTTFILHNSHYLWLMCCLVIGMTYMHLSYMLTHVYKSCMHVSMSPTTPFINDFWFICKFSIYFFENIIILEFYFEIHVILKKKSNFKRMNVMLSNYRIPAEFYSCIFYHQIKIYIWLYVKKSYNF